MKTRSLLALLGLLLLVPPEARSAAVPSPVFQEGAVLQRGKPIPVWGTADPGEAIQVSFRGETKSCTAGVDGRWSVDLSPREAESTPSELVISGTNRVVIPDVLVGDVWLASGQSNMEWKVGDAYDADLLPVVAKTPLIRELKIESVGAPKPVETFKGRWIKADGEGIPKMSAVAFAFARDIQAATGVPVGIINATRGGTNIESWMPAEAIDSSAAGPSVRARWKKIFDDFPAAKAAYDAAKRALDAEKADAKAKNIPFTKRPPDGPVGPGSLQEPSVLYNAMIAPVTRQPVKGVIWYQGEANCDRPGQYRDLLEALVGSWRRDRARENLPFYWVQLAGFSRYGNSLGMDFPGIREAQARALRLPDTAMAVAIDLRASDARDIHPREKQIVGRRLARIALKRLYGFPQVADSGPVWDPASLKIIPEKGEVRFSLLPATTQLRNPLPIQEGFELAGEDRVFHPAKFKVENATLIVTSAKVPRPAAIRYAWRNAPMAALCDQNGLPLAPFRSDDWPEPPPAPPSASSTPNTQPAP